jgi:hypothetical protein
MCIALYRHLAEEHVAGLSFIQSSISCSLLRRRHVRDRHEVIDDVEVEIAARALVRLDVLARPARAVALSVPVPATGCALVARLVDELAQTPGRCSRATATTSSGARSGVCASIGNGESPESALSHAPSSFASGSASTRSLLPIAALMPALPRARPCRPRVALDALVLDRRFSRHHTDTDSSRGSVSPSSSSTAFDHTFGWIHDSVSGIISCD